MDTEWDGSNERRKVDRKSVYEELGELRVRMTHLEESLGAIKELTSDVHLIKDLLTQGEGAFKAIRLFFYIIGPLVLAGYWIKDHLK